MSTLILEFAKAFVNGRLNADEFSNAYMELWRIERDKGVLQGDEPKVSSCLSSIFCTADMYNPNTDREEYELDAEQLRIKIEALLSDI